MGFEEDESVGKELIEGEQAVEVGVCGSRWAAVQRVKVFCLSL